MKLRLLAACLVLSPAALMAAKHTGANNYPTVERVRYVQECMRDHPGPPYEMTNKCSCAIDALSKQVPFDQYTTMSTAANANSIGGERGSYIRDTAMLQKQIKRYRELQAKAKQSCFIDPEAK